MIEQVRQARHFLRRLHWAMLIALGVFMLVYGVATAQNLDEAGAPAIDEVSDYTLWAIAAGFIGTFVVATVNRAHWSSAVKFGVFFGWCLGSAGVDTALTRELDVHNWVRAVLVVFVAGQATYLAGKNAIKQIELKTG